MVQSGWWKEGVRTHGRTAHKPLNRVHPLNVIIDTHTHTCRQNEDVRLITRAQILCSAFRLIQTSLILTLG